MIKSKIRSRIRGAILGTAIGDAFGMPVEGLSPTTIVNNFGHLRSMVAPKSKIHNLKRGQWTDDTQLMLAIGESIVSKGFLDFDDIAKRHVLCLNDPRGWGKSTLTGISRIKAGVNWWNSSSSTGVGNGIPMKIAPLGVLLASGQINQFEARTVVINISRMTHGASSPAIAGIIQMNTIAMAILAGSNGIYFSLKRVDEDVKQMECSFGGDSLLSEALCKTKNMVDNGNSLSEIRNIIGAGSFVVESFPLMIAAVLMNRDNPEKCLIELVAQGGDTDTTCAMAGAILGAAHGLSAFPKRWRRPLESYKRLITLADGLCQLSNFGQVSSFNERPRILFGKKPKKEQKCQ